MKNYLFGMLVVALFVGPSAGCQVGGHVLRDSVDVMAVPVLWLSKSEVRSPSNPNGSFNSDNWTSSQWGPKK